MAYVCIVCFAVIYSTFGVVVSVNELCGRRIDIGVIVFLCMGMQRYIPAVVRYLSIFLSIPVPLSLSSIINE